MSRIGSTISGFEQFLLTQLSRSNSALAASTFRTTTGLRYNSPADGPSAFLQVSTFQNQLARVNQVQSNVDTASTLAAELQVTLDEMRTELDSIRTKLVADEDNTLTAAQKSANQTSIDTSLESLRTLARTSTGGKRFLDGSHDYTYSGWNSSQIKKIDVFSIDDDTTIAGTVTSAATQSSIRYTGASSRINSGAATFTLTGKRGSTTITVASNELLTAVRDRINLDSHLTGITAVASGSNLTFTTVDYGDDATITLTPTSGTFTTSTLTTGADAAVTINGTAVSSSQIDGNRVSYFADGANVAVEFQAGFSGAFSTVTVSDDNIGRFALSLRDAETVKLGISALFPEVLGGISGKLTDIESGGTLSGLGTNSSAAIRIVDEAIAQLTSAQAQVDAFADISVASASRLLTEFATTLEDSIDTLNTVDEEEESVLQTRYQSLSDNAIAAIAIFQQQQTSMTSLLQALAGLA